MNERFARQLRFAPLGAQGQSRLERSSVLLVGCGALGGQLAVSLVRSGVGRLLIVDRDVVCPTNLPRQVLFEERHAHEGTPKVEAAREVLARIGGPTRIEVEAAHLDQDNLDRLARGCDLILDGTDNLQTRYLLNDWCVEHSIPWVHAAVVASEGRVLAVRPGASACLCCVFPEPPAPGSLETCETAGVIQPAVGLVASLQAGLALRILAGGGAALENALYDLDAWEPRLRKIRVERDPECACCALGERRFLSNRTLKKTVVFCGRNAVQVRGIGPVDLGRVARRLEGTAQTIQSAASILRFEVTGERLTLFADGRALVEGTEDEGRALALYDRYVGS